MADCWENIIYSMKTVLLMTNSLLLEVEEVDEESGRGEGGVGEGVPAMQYLW